MCVCVYTTLHSKYARWFVDFLFFVILILLIFFSFTVSLIPQRPAPPLPLWTCSVSFGLCFSWPSFLFNQVCRNQFITIENHLTSFILIIVKNSFFPFWITQSLSKKMLSFTWPVKDNTYEIWKTCTGGVSLPNDKNDGSWKLCLPHNGFRFAVRLESEKMYHPASW